MPLNAPRKILVLELWGLGDLTFSTVLIRKAVEAGDTVHVLAKPHALMLLQPTFPTLKFFPFQAGWTKFIHKYWVWRWNWRVFFSLLRQLHREHYDVAVSARDDPRDHLLMWLIGAGRRFGFPHDWSGIFLNAPVARSRGRRQHKVEDWRDLAAAMGYGGTDETSPRLNHAAYRSVRIDQVLSENRLPVVVLHTGARIAVRRWPLRFFEDLIARLQKTFSLYLILIPDPDGYGSELASLANAVLNDVTLTELVDVMGRASLVLCNDSGPGHLAAACNRPTITLFGPTEARWFRPWGIWHHVIHRDICPHRPCFDYCRFSEPYCMTRLTPATIWPEVEAHFRRLAAEQVIPSAIVPVNEPPRPKPLVAVIVATYKRPVELARLLRSLEPTDIPLAVVVVDNANDPGTSEVVETAQEKLNVIRVVPERNLGCGGGLALGEKEALGHFGNQISHFWIMDDDAVSAPDALEKLLMALSDEEAFVACPMILDEEGHIGGFPGLLKRPEFNAIRKGRVRTPEEYAERFGLGVVPFSWSTGISMLVERGALEAVGFHRDDFLVRGEDLDFSLRLTAWGKGIYVPDAQVWHLPPSGPSTQETRQGEHRKHTILLQNLAFISLHLPHGRRILRTVPGNLWRYLRTWGLFSVGEALASLWTGAVSARPAGGKPQLAAVRPVPKFNVNENQVSMNVLPASIRSAASEPSAVPRYRILQIFNRYMQYGGEEGSVYQIGDALMEQHDVEYYLQSTSSLIGERRLTDKIHAMYSMMHNGRAVKDLRRMQEIGKFHFWKIHNIFPTLSPSIYKEAFRLGVPILHYLHNYRMGCINGFFLDHGEMCQRCIKGNFIHSVKAKCWHESRLACGWMTLVMARIRAMDLFQNVCRWVAISEAQKAVHVEMGIPADRIDVIHHFYEAQGPAYPLPENGYALFLGRLSAEKGCMDLLKAWRAMPRKRKLVIAGDGPELPRMRRYAADHGLTNVDFIGFVPKEKQEPLWRGAAFLVVPSVWLEPFGMVVLEAWARGRTVVAYSMGALPEIITGETSGLLVEPFNIEALAAAMERLFGDGDLLRALSVGARSELETRFSKALWQRKINNTFRKVLTP